MIKKHIIEFWPYLGKNPSEIKINTLEELVCLGRVNYEQSHLENKKLKEYENLKEDVEKTWEDAYIKNPRMHNSLMLNIKNIADDGDTLMTNLSNYKTCFWLKKKLSLLPMEKQEELSKKFALLNIGLIVVTADNYILIEQRPENVPAPLMFLNYPCGNAEIGNKTLADSLNLESSGELGFDIFDSVKMPLPFVKNIYSLGLERESDEWTPCYTFVAHLDFPINKIKPNNEIRRIVKFPAEPEELANYIVRFYSPTAKNREIDIKERLVPNATAMLSLYVKDSGGNGLYQELNKRLSDTAIEKYGYEFEIREYTEKTNPFK